MQQAHDFLQESATLCDLVAALSEDQFERPTAFKGWTINNVLRHLHFWNVAADLSLTDPDQFQTLFKQVVAHLHGGSLSAFETEHFKGLGGGELVRTWQQYYVAMADRFAQVDPKLRLQWAGPSMSVRSSITARIMETWAHGQAVYDELGVVRENHDRIRNVAVLGVNTYGWTFKVNGKAAPEPMPQVRLTAPSGAVWTFGEENAQECIEGSAEAFCQVVTQVRNIADTPLHVVGENATAWMAIAQCFAGAPVAPPAPGTRKINPTP